LHALISCKIKEISQTSGSVLDQLIRQMVHRV